MEVENKCCANGVCDKCNEKMCGCGCMKCHKKCHMFKILIKIIIIVAIFYAGVMIGQKGDFRERNENRFMNNKFEQQGNWNNTNVAPATTGTDTTTAPAPAAKQ